MGSALKPVLYTVVVAGLWAGLALRSPTSTFHFAPAIVAAAWPVAARIGRGRAGWVGAVRTAGAGLFIALLTTLLLHEQDALAGPALVGGSGTGEAVIVALVGAVWGGIVLGSRRPGLVVRLLSEGRSSPMAVGSDPGDAPDRDAGRPRDVV